MNQENRDKIENELSVSLLLDNLSEAKDLSDVFRRAGVIPHMYESLEKFWYGSLNRLPGLCLVDVRLMSEGSLTLINHPRVKSGEMNLCFYYSDETAPLLYSAYEINHLGTVKKGPLYKAQIKGILNRLNIQADFRNKNSLLESSLKSIERRMSRLVKTTEGLKEEDYYWKRLKSICGQFDLQKEAESFHFALDHVFSTFHELVEYSVLELDCSGQKLTSPHIFSEKFKEIPSLWLGRPCGNGIEFFAQNLASQVALDLMAGELITLFVSGVKDNPDQMIFLKVESNDFIAKFDWEFLERYMGGLYSHIELKNNNINVKKDRYLPPWDLFATIDHFHFDTLSGLRNRDDSEKTLVNINFSKIVKVASSQKEMRFYWRKFFNDFLNRFEKQQRNEFKVVCLGVKNIGILTEKKMAEQVFSDLESYIMKYPYWKYFDNIDDVLAKDIRPTLQVIPFSVSAYLRYIELGSIDGIYVNKDLSTSSESLELSELSGVERQRPQTI